MASDPSTGGFREDLDPSATVGARVDDPFADEGLDDQHDSEISGYLNKAYQPHTGREQVSALSALSAQMDAYRPLRPDEQAACLARYQAGLTAAAVLSSGQRLSPRQRRQAELAVADGEQAQTELVGSMFRLILVIARELAAGRYGHERSLDLLSDLVGDACVAVVEAVSKFDPTRGPAFSLYAGRIIRERIRASLAHQSLIDIPASWLRVRRLATTLAPELAAELGRRPTIAEMQEGLRAQCMRWAERHLTAEQENLPQDTRVALMRAKLTKQGMLGAIERYEEVMSATQQMWNLDSPIGADGSMRLMDTVADDTGDRLFDPAELTDLRENLLQALESLPERDREIVLYRFGFFDGEVWTYARLAPRYKVSPERVRQIERACLQKLSGPGFESLLGFLPGS